MLKPMTGSRLLTAAIFCYSFIAVLFAQPHAAPNAISITPPMVASGSPELIRVSAPKAGNVTGDWLGSKIQFFPSRDGQSWFALAGVDVEQAAGPSTLQIHIETKDGNARDLSRPIEIHPAHYRTGALTVQPKFVEPGPEEAKQIAADVTFKTRVFATSASEPLWHGSFRSPVHAAPTDSFGTRRMFNGKLASIHKGTDFRAANGTRVHAGNAGIVVLARPLYYEGNCVILDHGLGLYTLSMHFSRIDVHEGQHVTAGQILGVSGATGRVTGPHLHWAVRYQNAYLDPTKLLRMNLSTVR